MNEKTFLPSRRDPRGKNMFDKHSLREQKSVGEEGKKKCMGELKGLGDV